MQMQSLEQQCSSAWHIIWWAARGVLSVCLSVSVLIVDVGFFVGVRVIRRRARGSRHGRGGCRCCLCHCWVCWARLYQSSFLVFRGVACRAALFQARGGLSRAICWVSPWCAGLVDVAREGKTKNEKGIAVNFRCVLRNMLGPATLPGPVSAVMLRGIAAAALTQPWRSPDIWQEPSFPPSSPRQLFSQPPASIIAVPLIQVCCVFCFLGFMVSPPIDRISQLFLGPVLIIINNDLQLCIS